MPKRYLLGMQDNSLHASGTFEVEMQPQPPYHQAEGVTLAAMGVDKRFTGPLDATGKVRMLAARTPVKGSAAYVALEHIRGTLDGRRGTFVAVHKGLMTRGTDTLAIDIVPDSGTGELKGIAGTMHIRVDDGQHHYTLDYKLSD